MSLGKTLAVVAIGALLTAGAHAQDWYASGSIGLNTQADSDNSGETGAFTTGNLGDGTTLDVAAGTDYGWSTEFDNGLALNGEIGMRMGNGWRFGGEIAYTSADVDTHTGVTLGGGSIDSVDAAAIASSPDPLGVTVAEVVADGQGDISSLGIFANAYYDLNLEGQFQPYVGVGLGFADVDVSYQPSGIAVIDDGETKFAYQLRAGGNYLVNETIEIFGEYTYRATEDIETDNVLFPGTLDIENKQNIFAIGVRYNFGG